MNILNCKWYELYSRVFIFDLYLLWGVVKYFELKATMKMSRYLEMNYKYITIIVSVTAYDILMIFYYHWILFCTMTKIVEQLCLEHFEFYTL